MLNKNLRSDTPYSLGNTIDWKLRSRALYYRRFFCSLLAREHDRLETGLDGSLFDVHFFFSLLAREHDRLETSALVLRVPMVLTPYSLGNTIDWKLRRERSHSYPQYLAPYSLGNTIDWKRAPLFLREVFHNSLPTR